MKGDDPDRLPTAEELVAAERLRVAFEDPWTELEDVVLARALRLAWAPTGLERSVALRFGRRRMVAVAALAAVVGLALVTGFPGGGSVRQWRTSRSTEPLFEEKVVMRSDRIDRIAWARGADLRENRFTRWGVR
jgi:hypothetical protein